MNETLDQANNLALAMDRLVRLISKRDHSELELREKLGRTFHLDIIEKAIESARENRWLPDPEELADRVAKSLNLKKKGQIYIQNYLRRKGLPAVERNEDKELGKARDLLVGQFGDQLDFEMKQRAYRFLSNRGFDDQVIKKVLYEK